MCGGELRRLRPTGSGCLTGDRGRHQWSSGDRARSKHRLAAVVRTGQYPGALDPVRRDHGTTPGPVRRRPGHGPTPSHQPVADHQQPGRHHRENSSKRVATSNWRPAATSTWLVTAPIVGVPWKDQLHEQCRAGRRRIRVANIPCVGKRLPLCPPLSTAMSGPMVLRSPDASKIIRHLLTTARAACTR